MMWGRDDLPAAEDAAVLRQLRRGHDTITLAKWYGVSEASIIAMIDRARAAERRAQAEWDEAATEKESVR